MRDLRRQRCDRIRALAALEVDGELSQLEIAYLDRHTEVCAECGTFRAHVAEFTHAIRDAATVRPRMRMWVQRREHARSLFGLAWPAAARGLAGVAAVASAVAIVVPLQLGTGSSGGADRSAAADAGATVAILGGREATGGMGAIVGGDILLIS